MGPGDLQDVLEDLRHEEHADLLVGLGRSDDAAVYRVTDDVAIVETVDFFPPIVDDPYLFGAIARRELDVRRVRDGRAGAVRAQRGGLPARDCPRTSSRPSSAGGADKVREAGGVIAGGHTVVDAEPKYGLCVTGRVHPRRILIKGGLRPGQRLFLSKPLGTGVIATAAKNDKCEPAVARRRGAEHAAAQPRGGARWRRRRGRPGPPTSPGSASWATPARWWRPRERAWPSQRGPAALAGRAGAGRAGQLQRRHGAQPPLSRGGRSGGSASTRRCRTRSSSCSASRRPRAACSSRSIRARAAAVHEGFARAGEPVWEIGEVTAEPRLALT